MSFVSHLLYFYHSTYSTYKHVVEPPRITTHPQNLKDAIPGNSATFTVQATGTEPLNYNWQWEPAEKGSGIKEWKPCNEGWSDGSALTISNVQKPNEGSYRCVISNHAGTEISKAAPLSVGKKPMHDVYKATVCKCVSLSRETQQKANQIALA